ncbi:hypothetical protein [Paraburkholderia sp. GAS448]|uniref:hypothetical protein n=1 Tax=Paraburkholderia sp. GAS448 TaxID=3035136 RepID=UPI003D1A96E1
MTVLHRNTPPDHASAHRKLPGWVWFIALWCGGVAAAVSLGFVFKLFMNATLFAITR